MSEGYPAERFSIASVAPKQAAALIRFGHHPDLDPTIHELVALRASQLNGCAFCIDMHWLDARAGGEEEARLYGLDAWRESPLYDERERGALALAEERRLAPAGDGVQVARFGALLDQVAPVHVDADAAAVDLRHAQVDQLNNSNAQRAFFYRGRQANHGVQVGRGLFEEGGTGGMAHDVIFQV